MVIPNYPKNRQRRFRAGGRCSRAAVWAVLLTSLTVFAVFTQAWEYPATAIFGYMLHGPPEGLNEVLEVVITGSDEEVVRLLSWYGGRRSIPALLEGVRRGYQGDLSREILEALRRLNSHEVVEGLFEIAQDRNVDEDGLWEAHTNLVRLVEGVPWCEPWSPAKAREVLVKWWEENHQYLRYSEEDGKFHSTRQKRGTVLQPSPFPRGPTTFSFDGWVAKGSPDGPEESGATNR